MNEEATPLTAGRTVSAGNDKERRDPSPNTAVRAGVGKSYTDRAATGVCGGQELKPHSNTDMDPTWGSDSTETAG